MKLREVFRIRKQARVMKRFVSVLSSSVNLDMMEIAKGKTWQVIHTKRWQKALEEKMDEVIPMFTYREWMLILSIHRGYERLSNNPTEDVRKNLHFFLEEHYKHLYCALQMKYYAIYQTRKKEDVFRVVMTEGAFVGGKPISAVFIHYKNGDRMCYDAKTGNRLVVENIDLVDDTFFIILVDQTKSKLDAFFSQLETFLFED